MNFTQILTAQTITSPGDITFDLTQLKAKYGNMVAMLDALELKVKVVGSAANNSPAVTGMAFPLLISGVQLFRGGKSRIQTTGKGVQALDIQSQKGVPSIPLVTTVIAANTSGGAVAVNATARFPLSFTKNILASGIARNSQCWPVYAFQRTGSQLIVTIADPASVWDSKLTMTSVQVTVIAHVRLVNRARIGVDSRVLSYNAPTSSADQRIDAGNYIHMLMTSQKFAGENLVSLVTALSGGPNFAFQLPSTFSGADYLAAYELCHKSQWSDATAGLTDGAIVPLIYPGAEGLLTSNPLYASETFNLTQTLSGTPTLPLYVVERIYERDDNELAAIAAGLGVKSWTFEAYDGGAPDRSRRDLVPLVASK